jgi:hypothetical protein
MIVPAAQLYTQAASPDDLIADEQAWGQTDLLAYAVPITYHPIFGSIVQPIYERFVKNQAWMPYLGYAAVALAVWGATRLRRRAWPWIAVGLFLFVMALGPALRVNGVVYESIRLPYALIGDRFPLNTLRSPDRYNLLLPLALAPLAGVAAADLQKRWRERRGSIIVGLIGALIVFEYLGVPYPTIDPLPASPHYADLAADPDAFAILDIPLERSDTKRYLYYQTLHGKPIVEGRVARVPADAYALFDAIPLLGGWRASIDPPYPPDLGHQLDQLAARDVREIIVHKDYLAPEQASALRDYFTYAPYYEDERIAVYSTQPPRHSFITVVDGIGLVDGWLSVPDSGAVEVHLRWAAVESLGTDYDYRLSLVDETGNVAAMRAGRLAPPTSTWRPGALAIGDQMLEPSSPLPPGTYRVSVELATGGEAIGAIELTHRILSLPQGPGPRLMAISEEPRARFGTAFELRAADVSLRGNLLSLYLAWHALQAPGADTIYFAHVIDGEGSIVAQSDGIHVGYTRPSSTWQTGEIVGDPIQIPLWSLPSGEYRIGVGLIDIDGARLQAIDSSGQPVPDNRYMLESRFTINRPVPESP